MVSLLLVLGLVLVAVAKYEPPKTELGKSPAAAADPNWDLKAAMQGEHQDGYVPLVVGTEFIPPEALPEEILRANVSTFGNTSDLEPASYFTPGEATVTCPSGATDEGETCGDDNNGGCNADPPDVGAWVDVVCDETVCGTIWADAGTRDTDWFRITFTEPTCVTWTAVADFPLVAGFVDTADCALAGALDPYATGNAGDTLQVSKVCGVGEYWLFISHQDYYDYPCGANNDYVAWVTCMAADMGACCDPATGDCDGPMDEATCSGMWSGTGNWLQCASCDPNPCPPPAGPGDNCSQPLAVSLPGDLPYESKNNYTCGRVNDYAETDMCYTYGYGGGEDGTFELNVTAACDVDFEFDPKGTTWTYFEIRTECIPPAGSCVGYARSTAGDPYSLVAVHFEPGTYYVHVDSWPSPDCIPDYDLNLTATPTANEGDNCSNPIVIGFGSGDLPYTLADQYNCGRLNHYSETCLGSYDGGEDVIIEFVPTENMTLDITLDPKTTTWSGIAVDDACPPAATCMGYVGNSSGDPKTIYNVSVTAGVSYFLMVDTYPSPDCIPDFDVTFTAGAGGPLNDDCADAEAVGDVTDLAFSTATASFDGGGTCLYSPNIWYCYTASCDGEVTVSLCGSLYDTKLAVYDGCSCDPLGSEVGCNDDACGLQSELSFMATSGSQYLIEVGGYSTNAGDGILNITCEEAQDPPYNDECTGAVVQTTCPVTVTGDNSWSTNEIPACLDDCGHAWEAFTITECQDVTIDYCGTTPAFELVYITIYKDDCPVTVCDPIFSDGTDWNLCGDGNVTMYFYGLQPGTYYIPVLACHPSYPTDYYEGPYTININCSECSYCPASGGCDEYIENVTFGDINNTTGCDGYGDYLSLSTEVAPGATYPISMSIGGAYSLDDVAIWIDFDQSLSFDADEVVLTGAGYGPHSGDVTIPADAALGETRMRVRLVWNLVATDYACGATTYGEAEDYTVDIVCTPADNEVGMNHDPMWMYYAFAIDPFMVDVYIAPDNVGGADASTIDLNSIIVNGFPCPATLGGPVLDFSCGPTVTATIDLPTFASVYGYPIGVNSATYNVSGQFLDTTPFAYSGTFTLYGKDPADPAKWLVPEDEVVLRADCDRTGFVNVSDAVFMLRFIFDGGEAPSPHLVGDIDCNAMVNISDVVYLISYIFGSGQAPCPAPNPN